jgi:hypothetical protein
MDFAFILLSLLLLCFATLAVYDGLYLHIIKYRLHLHAESRSEHVTHTIRAILFPGMVYFLFLKQDCTISFYLGLTFLVIDIIVLAIDAYMEHDSREFMGGLPRWEYILHLFVNGFHFASVAVFMAMKIDLNGRHISITPDLSHFQYYGIFRIVAINLLPGSILIALLHILVLVPKTTTYWIKLKDKIDCCKS